MPSNLVNSAYRKEFLHVVTLTPFFPSDKNPVNGCFVAEPVELFDRFGIDSTVIAVSPIYRGSIRPIASAPALCLRYPAIPGIAGLASAGNFLYARLASRLRRLHQEKPIDVIHAHGVMPCGHAAELLGRQMGIPYVVTVHGLDVLGACSDSGMFSRRRQRKATEVYARAQTVICISDKVQQNIRASTPPQTRTRVVHNGVDPELFSPAPDQSRPATLEILVVGTLLRSKGQALVLNAVARLIAAFPSMRCSLIGEGPDRPEYEALARELGIQQQVHFDGRKSREEVAQAMQRCSVFVLPSSNEALGCVYLEAMSCAKPVIGCRGQGIDGIIEHGRNGFLVSPEGLEELVQVFTHLFHSRELSERIGSAGRETVLRNFTLAHQAEELAAIYRDAQTSFLQEGAPNAGTRS